MGWVAVAVKQVVLKLLPEPPFCMVSGTTVPSGLRNTISRSPTSAWVIFIQTLARPRVPLITPMPVTVALKQVCVVARGGILPPVPLKVCENAERLNNKAATNEKNTLMLDW